MNTDKLKNLIETFKNELEGLDVFNNSLSIRDKDQNERAGELALREKKLIDREITAVNKTKELADKQLRLDAMSNELGIRQGKLDAEWKRMLADREKVDNSFVELSKEILKSTNDRKSLIEQQSATKEKEDILERKAQALKELN